MRSQFGSPDATRGALAAAICFGGWGLLPLFWRLLPGIHVAELIAHRAIWSLVLLAAPAAMLGFGAEIRSGFSSGRAAGRNFLSAALLTANWLVYVWSVHAGHVIESSLGYFLVPLVNVALGRFVLHEQLRPVQWFAIGCAAAGVIWMMAQLGRPPWVALALAGSWSLYGLMRKRSPLGSLAGLTAETMLIAPVALAFLLWRHAEGGGVFGRADSATHLIILSSGFVTAVPLLLFAYAARRVRLTTIGLLQYLSPSVQFAIGLLVFREPFSAEKAAGFTLIWAGLLIYTVDNLRAARDRA